MRIEKIKRIVFIVVLSMCVKAHSQTYSQTHDLEPPCDDCQAPENPIDGGLSFLIIAGAAYGIYESRKKKE